MTNLFHNPLYVAGIAILVVAVAAFGGASALAFKKDLLTEAMPALLAGLIAIAAITERATAVINDIWFGPRRAKAEDEVRLVNRKVNETAANVAAVRTVAKEAAKAGDMSIFTANAAAFSEAPVEKHEAEIKESDASLAEVKSAEATARLSLAFIIALFVSSVGVRTLASLFETSTLSSHQSGVFRVVDIVLTAGVLTGGTAGISAISELLGTYVNASRKRALENP